MEHAINYIKKKRGLKSMKIFDNAMHIECKEEIKFQLENLKRTKHLIIITIIYLTTNGPSAVAVVIMHIHEYKTRI